MKIGQPEKMAWDGRTYPIDVPTRWDLLDASSTGPWRSWREWRKVTQGGALEGVPVLTYEGRSISCLYVRI